MLLTRRWCLSGDMGSKWSGTYECCYSSCAVEPVWRPHTKQSVKWRKKVKELSCQVAQWHCRVKPDVIRKKRKRRRRWRWWKKKKVVFAMYCRAEIMMHKKESFKTQAVEMTHFFFLFFFFFSSFLSLFLTMYLFLSISTFHYLLYLMHFLTHKLCNSFCG